MVRPGLVSVTFRSLPIDRVVALAAEAGLQAIEWGGDVHVPHGDMTATARARALCEAVRLDSYAYGSYYRVGNPGDLNFETVLQTAIELGAPAIRVWAGNVGSRSADQALRNAIRDDLARCCDLAGERGVSIDLEFHDGTLTDTAASTVALIDAVDRPNLRSYWQPKHGFSIEQNLQDLALIGPRLGNLHVFHWWPDHHTRLPLSDGRDHWAAYLLAMSGPRVAALEFVRGDDPSQLLTDAAALRTLLQRSN